MLVQDIQSVPLFPPKTSKIGSSVVHWEEIKPNVALIRAVGGTSNDCYFAEKVLEARLSGFGIDRHQVDMRREAGWHDHIQPKAQRLLRNGQVTVIRNGYTNIIGKVIGDTGEYTTEIWRDDPNSRAISRWSCECAWNQFAWNRTRQWKRIEGRPCSHVLALYWKSLSTPLDDQPEDLPADPGQKQGPPTPPAAGPAPAPAGPAPTPSAPVGPPQPAGPRSFAPDGEGVYQNPDFPRPQPTAPPGEPMPMSPAEQLNAMTPQEPGQTPPGLPAPPNTTVSVPGARPQTPMNPIQYPGAPGMGGTLSSVKTAESDSESFEEGSIVRTTTPVFGLAEGKSEAHGAGQYQEIPEGATGEVLSQDKTLGWVEVIFPLDGGELTPYHVRVFCNPSDLKKTRIRPPGPFVRRRSKTSMAISEQDWDKWRNNSLIPQGRELYHGTADKNVESIMQEGLVPNKNPEYSGSLRARPGYIYLTDDLETAWTKGSNQIFTDWSDNTVLLKIDPSFLDPSLIVPDEDTIPDSVKRENRVGYPDGKYDSVGEMAEAMGYGDDPEETAKMIGSGNLAYGGIIPPEAISVAYDVGDYEPPCPDCGSDTDGTGYCHDCAESEWEEE